MLKTRVTPFEFAILKRLKLLEIDWPTQHLLLASSAGRDSAVLLKVLSSLQSRLEFKLSVAHVDHGISTNKKVASYRKKASAEARKQAKGYAAAFFLLEHSGKELASEADFRKVRERLLEDCRIINQCDSIVFAHHADDLLETRLIRLIRGTGAQGLQAMNTSHGCKLRPLLQTTQAEIAKFAQDQNLKWVDDPTNAENQYFRNWLRNNWLPQLELKRAGSRQSLARSLQNIAEAVTARQTGQTRLEVIKRKEFAALSTVGKREVLARVMLEQGARDFSRRQLDEILKRLSSQREVISELNCGVNRGILSFEVGGLQWRVNAEQIEAVRLV